MISDNNTIIKEALYYIADKFVENTVEKEKDMKLFDQLGRDAEVIREQGNVIKREKKRTRDALDAVDLSLNAVDLSSTIINKLEEKSRIDIMIRNLNQLISYRVKEKPISAEKVQRVINDLRELKKSSEISSDDNSSKEIQEFYQKLYNDNKINGELLLVQKRLTEINDEIKGLRERRDELKKTATETKKLRPSP